LGEPKVGGYRHYSKPTRSRLNIEKKKTVTRGARAEDLQRLEKGRDKFLQRLKGEDAGKLGERRGYSVVEGRRRSINKGGSLSTERR